MEKPRSRCYLCSLLLECHFLHVLSVDRAGEKNVCISLYFSFLSSACEILVPQPGIEPMPCAVEVRSLNLWSTREVSLCISLEIASSHQHLQTPVHLHMTLPCLPSFLISTFLLLQWESFLPIYMNTFVILNSNTWKLLLDGWMASPTRWTWVWASSGSWWWIGKPGMLQSVARSRKRLSDWTELKPKMSCREKPYTD